MEQSDSVDLHTDNKTSTVAVSSGIQIDGPRAALSNFLSSLDPPLCHIIPQLNALGIQNEDELRFRLRPEARDELCTTLLDGGVPILDWMALVHSQGEAATRSGFSGSFNAILLPVPQMADALWNVGLRTMEDVHVLARFPGHWAAVRTRLLRESERTMFANWLMFKRALRSLNPPAETPTIDDGIRHFLRGLSRSLLKYSTIFSTTFCLDSTEELDALCKMPEQWNAVGYMMLDSGNLVLMDALAFLGGLERRAEDLSRRP